MFELHYFCCGCTLARGVRNAAASTFSIGSINLIAGCLLYSSRDSYDSNYDYMTPFALMLTTSITAFILVICLIIALLKKNSVLLLPWLIFFGVDIILTGINISMHPNYHDWFYVIYAAILSYFIYLWLVVYSYFRQLRREAMGLSTQFTTPILISPPQYGTTADNYAYKN